MKNNDSSLNLGFIIVLLLVIILAIGFLFFFVWKAGLIPVGKDPVPVPTSEIESNAEIHDAGQDRESNLDEYKEIPYLPFEFKFSVPSDWDVETAETGSESSSQKCLTHNISSPDGLARLEVVPMCGAFGMAPVTCPQSTEIIGIVADDSLVRYPVSSDDSVFPKMTYANAADNSCIEYVLNSTITLKVTAVYNGPVSELPQYLSQLDKIVLSLAQ